MHTRRSSPCSKWYPTINGLLLALGLLSACHSPAPATGNPKNPTLSALLSLPGFRLGSRTKAVFIVADNSCMGCNKSFAELATTYLPRPDMQFVVSASESNIDLSDYYRSKGTANLYIDSSHRLTDNALVNGSTILFLRDGDVDTALQVDASQLEGQLGYIKGRLAR